MIDSEPTLVKLFGATYLLGAVLALAALVVAYAAVTRDDLPVIGTGAGALIVVAVIGTAACTVGGISQAPALGWTNPTVVLGTVLGVLAIVVILAGLLGWAGVLAPFARLVPGQAAELTPARTATFVLAGLIGLKWLIATGMAALAR